jgi:hypothetical protein
LRAAAFAKSFLDLEGELTPILVSLVSKDKQAHSMLDQSGVKLSKTIQVHLDGPSCAFFFFASWAKLLIETFALVG